MSKEKNVKIEQQMYDEAIRLAAEGDPCMAPDRVDELLRLIGQDAHEASARPCETCRKITALVKKPFWCLRLALARRAT